MVNWFVIFPLILCGLVFAGLIIVMLFLIVTFVIRKTFGIGADDENQKLFERSRLLWKLAHRFWLVGFSLAIATVIVAIIVEFLKSYVH